MIVRPWYRQFYLRRGDADWSSDQVSEDGYTRGLEVIDGFVYVGTTMYGSPTEVVIDLHVSDPGLHPSADRHSDALLDGDGNLDVLNWGARRAAGRYRPTSRRPTPGLGQAGSARRPRPSIPMPSSAAKTCRLSGSPSTFGRSHNCRSVLAIPVHFGH